MRNIELRKNRYEFEPKTTAKVAERCWRLCETRISYRGRTYAEGQKIGWKDGVGGIWCILRYDLFG